MRGIKRYDEVLRYLEEYHRTHGKMPTMKHAEYELGIPHGSMHRILRGLACEGKIIRIYGIPYVFK
jgi:hypothetical protein